MCRDFCPALSMEKEGSLEVSDDPGSGFSPTRENEVAGERGLQVWRLFNLHRNRVRKSVGSFEGWGSLVVLEIPPQGPICRMNSVRGVSLTRA